MKDNFLMGSNPTSRIGLYFCGIYYSIEKFEEINL